MRRFALPLLFAGTLFLSASLLFSVQPLIGKLLLPKFGGAAAVWNTCMVFFQAVLLMGYGYSHLLTHWLSLRNQAICQGALLLTPLLVLPIVVPPNWVPAPDIDPILSLLGLLLVVVGLPFFTVSTMSPLLQRWFAESGHPAAKDPYFLNSASNAGSMLALLSYPTLIEPSLALRPQGWLWTAGYLLLMALTAICATVACRAERREPSIDSIAARATASSVASAPNDTRAKLLWILLAFVPSSLMLGVTTCLTTDIAPVPFMWIVPLALYLLSFILVFAQPPAWVHRSAVWLLPVAVIYLANIMYDNWVSKEQKIAVHLLTFFLAAMVCHGELARRRPAAEHLTGFYWWMSVGGVLGGLFTALAAPFIFTSAVEYPLVLVLALALLPPLVANAGAAWRPWFNKLTPWALAGLAAIIFFRFERLHDAALGSVYRERNFYGILDVCASPDNRSFTFTHGNVRHGTQFRSEDPRMRRIPTLYFFPTGPIGQVFREFRSLGKSKVAIIGLGAGSLASYAEPKQDFTFYEIDPAVLRIAAQSGYFTFLQDAEARGARVNTILGDARARFQEAPDDAYDLIVLDAFSGDAIPVHLLTREAIELYLRKLKPGGWVAMHISNKYLDLPPVVGDIAQSLQLAARIRNDDNPTEQDRQWGKEPSTWAILARQTSDLGPLANDPLWKPLAGRPNSAPWTDDYSNVFAALRW
jgi:SAM-dependent methyltransferase